MGVVIEHVYYKMNGKDEHGQEKYIEARINIWGSVFYVDSGRRHQYPDAPTAHQHLINSGWKWKKSINTDEIKG